MYVLLYAAVLVYTLEHYRLSPSASSKVYFCLREPHHNGIDTRETDSFNLGHLDGNPQGKRVSPTMDSRIDQGLFQ